MDERTQQRLKTAPRFDTQQAALQEAVKRVKENETVNEMVMRQEDGKFMICDWTDWEIAVVHGGCEPVYGSCYIYDLAAGRNPSDADNRNELDAFNGGGSAGGVKKAMRYDQVRGKN